MTELNFTRDQIAAWKASYSPEDRGIGRGEKMVDDLLALHDEVAPSPLDPHQPQPDSEHDGRHDESGPGEMESGDAQ